MTLSAGEFGVGQVLLSMFYFTLFFIWVWLLISVFGDIFRSHDMGGGAKAAWCIFVIVAPFLGVFVYLVARGRKMGEHAVEEAQRQDAATREYIRQTAGTASAAEELTKLAALRDQGVIDEAEFQSLKANLVGA